MTYTYTVYEGDPALPGSTPWSDRQDAEIEAADPTEAAAKVRQIVGCDARVRQARRQTWANIWHQDGMLVSSAPVRPE